MGFNQVWTICTMFAFPHALLSVWHNNYHDDDDDDDDGGGGDDHGYGYDVEEDDDHHDHGVDLMMMMAGNLQEDVCACFAVMPLSGIRHPSAMRIIMIMITMIMIMIMIASCLAYSIANTLFTVQSI